jgi:hypothetical protein
VTDAGGTIGVRMATRRQMHGRVYPTVRAQSLPRANLLVALLALAGVILPSEVQISLGAGARFTSGRIAVALLLVPALFALCRKGRRIISCDFLVFATAAWMIVASLSSVGVSALSASGGDALDFLGGYLITRAFSLGRPALDTFIRILKAFAAIAIILAIADSVSGRFVVHDAIGALLGVDPPQAVFRNNAVRAASTFDHPILFGAFCALTAAILLYWEQNPLQRSLVVGVCFLGCMLSLSSAAIMAFAIVLAAYIYDRSMSHYRWRWSAFWMVTGILGAAFFVVATNPLSWVIGHLTLDPQTGYFRMMIWDTALAYIAQAPLIGYAYELFHNNILDQSVDSIWLLYSLRFGVPICFLFFLANLAAFFPSKREFSNGTDDYMDRMRRAFTLVLLMFMFTGLTVHFWNYMWMFWGLCLGMRASLRELSFGMSRRPAYTR